MKQRYSEVSLSGHSRLGEQNAQVFRPFTLFKFVCLLFTFGAVPVMELTQRQANFWLEIMKNSHLNNTLDFDPQSILASQAPQYKDASLNEILDLLECAVETYSAIAPTLPQQLRESAEQEIDFFYFLTQKRLGTINDRLIHRNDYQVAA
jgi:hypothetical protein